MRVYPDEQTLLSVRFWFMKLGDVISYLWSSIPALSMIVLLTSASWNISNNEQRAPGSCLSTSSISLTRFEVASVCNDIISIENSVYCIHVHTCILFYFYLGFRVCGNSQSAWWSQLCSFILQFFLDLFFEAMIALNIDSSLRLVLNTWANLDVLNIYIILKQKKVHYNIRAYTGGWGSYLRFLHGVIFFINLAESSQWFSEFLWPVLKIIDDVWKNNIISWISVI